MNRVPLLDLSPQNVPLTTEIDAAIRRVVDSGQFILGPEVDAFERELANLLDVPHAVTVSSGTDALLLALMALGVERGDEVVTTPFSFFATVGCILRVGASPVFADIDAGTFNLDADAADAACTPRTRAIIPVHLFGRPAELPRTEVPIVEDAAQSIGASTLGGAVGCLSFFPSKNLGAFGDAGALYTRDPMVADRARLLRAHGARPKYVHPLVGGNFRLDAIQAAILRVKLPHLGAWTESRRQNALRYHDLFHAESYIPPDLRLPTHHEHHIYNQFVIRAPNRDALREHLTRFGVGTEVYYPVPLHLQPCLAHLGLAQGQFPRAEALANEALALPIFPGLAIDQQSYVVRCIGEFYRGEPLG